MHVGVFDRFVAGGSSVHRLDPRVKVVITILFIVGNLLLPDGAWLGFLSALILVLLAGRVAGLPPFYLIKRSLIALPFALAAVTILFTTPGEPLFSLWPGGGRLAVTAAGIVRFASILARSLLSVLAAILLTATTQFPDLMHALRHLRVPAILINIVGFMYRYLFVLADEAGRLLRAREARSARAVGSGGGSLLWRARVAGGMVGQLFLRSFERSERVYNAMVARGYRGQLLTMNPHAMTARDWRSGFVAVGLILLVQIIGRI